MATPEQIHPTAVGPTVGHIIKDVEKLSQQMILLGKEEMKESLLSLRYAMARFFVGVALAFLAILLLGFFATYGLSAVTALPLWTCFAITLVVAAVGSALLLASSMHRLRETTWLPHETLDSLKENVTWIKTTLENETSSMK